LTKLPIFKISLGDSQGNYRCKQVKALPHLKSTAAVNCEICWDEICGQFLTCTVV